MGKLEEAKKLIEAAGDLEYDIRQHKARLEMLRKINPSDHKYAILGHDCNSPVINISKAQLEQLIATDIAFTESMLGSALRKLEKLTK